LVEVALRGSADLVLHADWRRGLCFVRASQPTRSLHASTTVLGIECKLQAKQAEPAAV
jgi:hypothetical protein